MGSKFTVTAWMVPEWAQPGQYEDIVKWSGQSFLAAIWNWIKVKREGHGCVSIAWR